MDYVHKRGYSRQIIRRFSHSVDNTSQSNDHENYLVIKNQRIQNIFTYLYYEKTILQTFPNIYVCTYVLSKLTHKLPVHNFFHGLIKFHLAVIFRGGGGCWGKHSCSWLILMTDFFHAKTLKVTITFCQSLTDTRDWLRCSPFNLTTVITTV